MSHSHCFNAVSDELTACQTVFHTDVSHSDAVAHTDGRNLDRSSSCHSYTGLDSFSHLIEVHMSRNNFTLGGNHTDKRTFKFFLCITHRIEKASHRSFFHTLGYLVTS